MPLIVSIAFASVFSALSVSSGSVLKTVGPAVATVAVNVGSSVAILGIHFWLRKLVKPQLDEESSADELSSDEGDQDDFWSPYASPYGQRGEQRSRPDILTSV
jgi:hypothetical protein